MARRAGARGCWQLEPAGAAPERHSVSLGEHKLSAGGRDSELRRPGRGACRGEPERAGPGPGRGSPNQLRGPRPYLRLPGTWVLPL